MWSPEQWDSFSSVGIALFVVALFVTALVRGWVVIGRFHSELVDGRDRVIEKLEARGTKDAETIATLSQALVEKNATEDATTRILASVREALAAGDTP